MAELISFDHPFLSRSRLPRKKPNPTVLLIPDDLVREILTWVPVKSLMRLKRVSRIWLSIITDPLFAAVYRGGFRGLLLSEPSFRLAKERRFYYASVDDRPSYHFHHHLTMDHGGKLMGCTETLNGLLCFYYREYSRLYNPATREELQLPSSAVDPDPSKSQDFSYHFGYDPVNKLYKLLKICPVYDGNPDDGGYRHYENMQFVENLNCEILTIGVDSSWRILECCPPMEIMTESRCINGVLYWLEPDARERKNLLVAFHLVEEKFQLIPTPGECVSFGLPMFSPSLALTGFQGVQDTKIYHYCGDGKGMWECQNLKLPSVNPKAFVHPYPEGILPNGKVFISEDWNSYLRPIFLFDPTKGELEYVHPDSSSKKIESYNHGNSCFYQENIIPLKCFDTQEFQLQQQLAPK